MKFEKIFLGLDATEVLEFTSSKQLTVNPDKGTKFVI